MGSKPCDMDALNQAILDVCAKHPNNPVWICGDFNGSQLAKMKKSIPDMKFSTFRFNLTNFQLNTDFPSQFFIVYRKIT